MKGAKELAEMLRARVGNAPTFPELAMVRHADALAIAAHLDRLAAIDSAVTGEVGDIAAAHAEHRSHFRCDQMPDSIVRMDTLLVIVQRQTGDSQAALNLARGYEQERDAARAEVERLKLEVAALKAERDHLATTRMESSAEIDRLQTEHIALAQENARLINEVGELDATAREQRQRAEVLARGLAAYRVGGFTAGQVWENEEGKAVK